MHLGGCTISYSHVRGFQVLRILSQHWLLSEFDYSHSRGWGSSITVTTFSMGKMSVFSSIIDQTLLGFFLLHFKSSCLTFIIENNMHDFSVLSNLRKHLILISYMNCRIWGHFKFFRQWLTLSALKSIFINIIVFFHFLDVSYFMSKENFSLWSMVHSSLLLEFSNNKRVLERAFFLFLFEIQKQL